MESFLDSAKDSVSRRMILVTSISLFVLFAVTLWWLTGVVLADPKNSFLLLLSQILNGIVQALATSGFLLILIRLVSRRENDFRAISVLDPAQTSSAHEAELKRTDFWKHDGHIGRWVRTTAIPSLAKQSNDFGADRTVELLILDPLNLDVCNRYASYRERLKQEAPVLGHYEDTIAELITTCLAAAIYNSKYAGLQVSVYLKSRIEYSRMDIGATRAFHTLADPRCNAVSYSNSRLIKRHGFYDTARLSFESNRDEARLVALVVDPVKSVNEAVVRKFISDNGLTATPPRDALVNRIVSLYNVKWNPFK